MSREDPRRPLPAVNDNQSDATSDRTADPQSHDACRADLLAMPEVGTLDFTAQFIVWALRSWVVAFKLQGEPRLDFADATEHAFDRFGLSASAAALDGMMTVLAATASRCIDIRCVQCRFLSPDEAMLIDAVAAAQTGGFFAAHGRLRELMPAAAVRSAYPHLLGLARDLAAADMRAQPILVAGKSAEPVLEARAGRYLH